MTWNGIEMRCCMAIFFLRHNPFIVFPFSFLRDVYVLSNHAQSEEPLTIATSPLCVLPHATPTNSCDVGTDFAFPLRSQANYTRARSAWSFVCVLPLNILSHRYQPLLLRLTFATSLTHITGSTLLSMGVLLVQ